MLFNKGTLWFLLAVSGTSSFANDAELKLWYREPAKQWTQALPVGNGRLV